MSPAPEGPGIPGSVGEEPIGPTLGGAGGGPGQEGGTIDLGRPVPGGPSLPGTGGPRLPTTGGDPGSMLMLGLLTTMLGFGLVAAAQPPQGRLARRAVR
ncbi:MAG TPA: hypothetical protein VNB94_12230 [Mycobacteriales bacterium]|nr:hypothetical protein [Mycobacteriales bacterium]